MHDDHFVIEDGPWRWMEPNFGGWFDREIPPGHSVVYPSLMYVVLWLCHVVGMDDPQAQMFVMRLLHGGWSLVAFPFVWKLASRYGGEGAGVLAAFLFAVFWPLPFMSVRNLIEMASLPPLMIGWWYTVRENKRTNLIIAGIAFAVAFCFRYHSALVPIALFVVLTIERRRTDAMILLGSCAGAVLLTQGLADILAWGYPFAGPMAYIESNVRDISVYISSPWYTYLVLITGMFLAPTSIIAIFALFWVRDRRFWMECIVPIGLFLFAHSVIENKQERFLLPIIGLLIVVGSVAWTKGRENRPHWLHNNWFRYTGVWFFALNTVLVVFFTTAYSKRSRVEAMSEIRSMENVHRIAVVADSKVYVPRFYAGRDISVDRIIDDTSSESWNLVRSEQYDAVVFFGQTSHEKGKMRFEDVMGLQLTLVEVVEPGFIDNILFVLNPRGNKNEKSFIYRCYPPPANN